MVEAPSHPLKVFLCYAHSDSDRARALYKYLVQNGVDVWFDEEKLLPGQDWQLEIRKAVRKSDVVIVCLSNNFNTAGYQQKEVRLALDTANEKLEGDIFIIPVRLEECSGPESLTRWQWVDLFEKDGYRQLRRALDVRALQIGALLLTKKNSLAAGKSSKPKEVMSTPAKRVETKSPAAHTVKGTPEAIPAPGVETAAVGHDAIGRDQTNQASDGGMVVQGNVSGPVINAKNVYMNPPGGANIAAAQPEVKAFTQKHKQENKKNLRTRIIVIVVVVLAIICLLALTDLPWRSWFAPVPIPTSTPTSTATLIVPTETVLPMNTLEQVLPLTATFLPTEIIDSKGVTMRLVQAGVFTMGSKKGAPNEQPVHDVYLDSYYIDTYEVTNVLYQACADAGVCDPPKQSSSNTRSKYYGNPEFDDYPVIYVNWQMAEAYCIWRGAELPTEAQWEKAARGTDGHTYPWGEGIDKTLANYNKYMDDTTRVGSYKDGISPYGLYDMAGNVAEWVRDWYLVNYYLSSPLKNPFGPDTGQFHLLRGGSWDDDSDDVRSTYRDRNVPLYAMVQFGFRCARPAP